MNYKININKKAFLYLLFILSFFTIFAFPLVKEQSQSAPVNNSKYYGEKLGDNMEKVYNRGRQNKTVEVKDKDGNTKHIVPGSAQHHSYMQSKR